MVIITTTYGNMLTRLRVMIILQYTEINIKSLYCTSGKKLLWIKIKVQEDTECRWGAQFTILE